MVFHNLAEEGKLLQDMKFIPAFVGDNIIAVNLRSFFENIAKAGLRRWAKPLRFSHICIVLFL
jgi:hypothetical protein